MHFVDTLRRKKYMIRVMVNFKLFSCVSSTKYIWSDILEQELTREKKNSLQALTHFFHLISRISDDFFLTFNLFVTSHMVKIARKFPPWKCLCIFGPAFPSLETMKITNVNFSSNASKALKSYLRIKLVSVSHQFHICLNIYICNQLLLTN